MMITEKASRRARNALFLGICFLVSGCDVMFGVRRIAPVQRWPSVDCLKEAIAHTPGVASVKYSHQEEGTYIRWSGCSTPAGITDRFLFRGSAGSHIVGVLQVFGDCAGAQALTLSRESINVKPPQVEIDATRPIMELIARRVESQCNLAGLVSTMTEQCRGVSCPPLAAEPTQSRGTERHD